MIWLFFFIIDMAIIVYIGYLYNEFVNLRNKIGEEWETICTNLKDRFNVMKELMEANKDLSFNYQETNDLMDNLLKVTSKIEFVPLYQNFENKVNEFLGLIDNTKNSTIITKLNDTNGKINYVKNFYNDNVSSYNNKIDMFPSNLIAKFMNYQKDVLIP